MRGFIYEISHASVNCTWARLKEKLAYFAGLVLGVLVGIWLHKEPSPVIMTTLTFIGQVFIRLIQW